jgi:hypothetical protein
MLPALSDLRETIDCTAQGFAGLAVFFVSFLLGRKMKAIFLE